MARHGFNFLLNKMWDKQYGGFYNLVTKDGTPKSIIKEAYGNAFAIYGLSAYYECSLDEAALDLAKATFLWLEKNSHDSVYKGYYQHLNRDGSHVIRTAETESSAETGYKDQNSSIHLLEAFTELYKGDMNYRLIVVGNGSQYDDLRDQVKNLAMEQQIQFTGILTREMTAQTIASADCVICFSRLETFGVPIIESWACGIPVITTTAQEIMDKYGDLATD
jgi:mannose/cellobiose epimerase-like protein (N-acyl-D-glucosamine 2-epimerase family)